MPLKLFPPDPERRYPNYRLRGTYLGVRVDKSTETADKRKADAFKKRTEAAIERGQFATKEPLSFAAAVDSYLNAGGEDRFMEPIVRYFMATRIAAADIDQAAVDAGAVAVYPSATAATRNRQFYTPVLAVLRHAKLTTLISRPKGACGTPRRVFLKPAEFERLVKAARAIDIEFEVLTVLLFYTGLRLSEALRLRCADLHLDESFAFCGVTKNGEPRPIYLPPRVVAALANHPRGLDRNQRLFKWSKSGALYTLAAEVYKRAGVDDHGARFHIFRHSYGRGMTQAGADLVATGVWKSPTAARVYEHWDTNEESRKADSLPGAKGPPRTKQK